MLNRLASLVPEIPATQKKRLKNRVFSRVQKSIAEESLNFEDLENELQKLTLTVAPTAAFKLNTKRNLLAVFTLRKQRVWLGDLVLSFWRQRRFASTVVACVLLITIGFGYIVHLPQVSAAKVSGIQSFQGEVMIDRGAESFAAEDGFLVLEGDVMRTGGNGWVTMAFEDDSLVTLGPSTTVSLSRLWSDPQNEAKTTVHLDLDQGLLWATVVNLLPGESSFVVNVGTGEGEASFSVDRKAMFDVSVLSEQEMTLRVFDQLVDFTIKSGGLPQEGTLGPDLVLTLTQDGTLTTDKIFDLDALKMNDVWVKTNFQNSLNYEASLQDFYATRIRESAGALPGEVRYVVKRNVENVQGVFLFEEGSKEDHVFNLANRRFSEAILLRDLGDIEAAEAALQDYQTLLTSAAEQWGYDSVKPLLDEHRKTIASMALGENVEFLQQAVEQTAELAAAGDSSARSQVQLQTAADRLGLALELIQIGAYDLAVKSLQDYQVNMNQVLDELVSLDMEARKEVVLQILGQKVRDLEMLKLIFAELAQLTNGAKEASVGVQTEVDTAYQDTLYQLNMLVLNLKERAVLHLSIFLKDAKGDRAIQEEILGRLKKSVPLDFETIQLINDIEEFYASSDTDVIRLNDTVLSDGGLPSGDTLILPQTQNENVENFLDGNFVPVFEGVEVRGI